MLGLIFLVGLGFGIYKLVQWGRKNTDLNLSGKNVAIVIGISFLALIKWAYGSGSKTSDSSWMRTYTCNNCGRTIKTIFNPKDTEKTTCAGGYQHQWRKVNE